MSRNCRWLLMLKSKELVRLIRKLKINGTRGRTDGRNTTCLGSLVLVASKQAKLTNEVANNLMIRKTLTVVAALLEVAAGILETTPRSIIVTNHLEWTCANNLCPEFGPNANANPMWKDWHRSGTAQLDRRGMSRFFPFTVSRCGLFPPSPALNSF